MNKTTSFKGFMHRKYNEGDKIFFLCCGMYVCLIVFYFSGEKELALELSKYVVGMALGGIGLSYIMKSTSKANKTKQPNKEK